MRNKLLLLAMGIALSAQTLMAQVPSYVPTDGLVGYWPFDGNANDISGNGNNGTNNGAALTTDRFGNINSAYTFNGSSSFIAVPHNTIFNMQKATWNVWVKSNVSTTGNGRYIMGKRDDAAHMVTFYERNGLGGQEIGWASGAATGQISSTINGSWHMLTMTYDLTLTTNNYSLYYDGILVPTPNNNIPLSFIFNNGDLRFGKQDNSSFFQPFNGSIDDASIYNRILSEAEITAIYNGVSYSDTCNNVSGSLTQGLVGYWPFCGNANDDSGNGNNGTVNGATLTTDRFGNANGAYSFNGINNWIDIQNNSTINFQNEFSISLWLNTNQNNINAGLIGKWNDFNGTLLGGQEEFAITVNDNVANTMFALLRTNTSPNTNFQVQFDNSGYNGNQWNLYTYVFSNNNISLYKNGTLVGTSATTGTIVNYIQNLEIGRYGGGQPTSGGNTHFSGTLDDIGIWNRALTTQEITQLYNQTPCFNLITVTDTLIINVGQLSYNNPIAYANNITIAPNPASTQININFNNITDLNGGSLKVINSLGQEVGTTPITTSGTQSIMQLATWGGSGMYYVQIINPQGIVVDVKKIILQ
jgi:hypothetical protein